MVAKSRCRMHRLQTTTIAMDAKPTKHTQTLTLRKGSRPNFFGRQHLTFDKGGKGDSARQRDYCTFAMVVRIEGVDATEAIPPVAARILSGDSTSPLTREARVLAIFEG